MAAVIIGAIDQQPANTTGTHLSEGDLLAGEGGHAAIKTQSEPAGKLVYT
jgi:hypothetical protein